MFKDYYSILGIPFQSSDEEIKRAYNAKVEKLGSKSTNTSSSNYQMRADVEEAFRILGASYSLKAAYDEEYQKAVTENMKISEIKDEWLLSEIERERLFVASRILTQNHESPKTFIDKKKSWGMKVLGCLGKAFIVYLCLMTFVYIKKCSRDKIRDSYNISNTSISSESAEFKLVRLVREKNITLPQDMDENITNQAVLLENDALIYVYKVDDSFFSEFKCHAISKDIQLNNLKTVYSEMKPMIDLLIETHRGICYRYVCRKSGEVTEFKIYCSDLMNLE